MALETPRHETMQRRRSGSGAIKGTLMRATWTTAKQGSEESVTGASEWDFFLSQLWLPACSDQKKLLLNCASYGRQISYGLPPKYKNVETRDSELPCVFFVAVSSSRQFCIEIVSAQYVGFSSFLLCSRSFVELPCWRCLPHGSAFRIGARGFSPPKLGKRLTPWGLLRAVALPATLAPVELC